MRHNPLSDDELEAKLVPGIVSFFVKKATDEISRAKNEQIKLVLECVDRTGMKGIVWDYLVSPSVSASDDQKRMAELKLNGFCKAIGHPDYYKNDVVNPDFFAEKTGTCEIELQKGTDGWPDKMRVKKYIPYNQNKAFKDTSHLQAPVDEFNDGIPF